MQPFLKVFAFWTCVAWALLPEYYPRPKGTIKLTGKSAQPTSGTKSLWHLWAFVQFAKRPELVLPRLSEKKNLVNSHGTDSNHRLPPWRSEIRLAIVSPMPSRSLD